MREDTDKAITALIARGLVHEAGRDQKGEIVYELTKEGEKYADKLIEELTKRKEKVE